MQNALQIVVDIPIIDTFPNLVCEWIVWNFENDPSFVKNIVINLSCECNVSKFLKLLK